MRHQLSFLTRQIQHYSSTQPWSTIWETQPLQPTNYNMGDYRATDEDGLMHVQCDSWALTDFGQVGIRSRDGSLHATDEVFNAASHLAATLFSILGTVLLVAESSSTQLLDDGTELPPNVWKIVSFSIYGASLIFLFGCSTIHHAVVGPMEGFFRKMDYLAIYPLIGGTFTPLCLVYYHDNVIGWAFCATVWGIAAAGMIATACWFDKIPKWWSMTMYITLGWLGAGMTHWLIPKLGWSGFGLFLWGGCLYTAGGYVYTMETPNPMPGRFGFHEIWHLAVVLAALTHWMLMYNYVLVAEV
jgi:hemolysin III